MRSKKPLRVPPEIWELIREQLLQTELNILVLIRLSGVSRSSRQVFLSDKSWKILDPYGFGKNIYAKFCNLANSLPPSQQKLLRLSWSWGKRYCLMQHQQRPGPNEKPSTYTHPICSQGLRAWGYTLEQIQRFHLDPHVDLYTKMGILRTDCYSLLKYQIRDPVFLKCLLHHHPGSIRLADPKIKEYGELRFLAVMRDFAQGGLCSLTLEGLPDDLKIDKERLIELLKVNPNNFSYVSREMARDRDVALAAISADGKMIEAVPSTFKYDVEMNLAALNAIDYDEWLEHLEGPLMENPLIAEAAVRNTNYGYKKLPRSLRKSRKLCHLAVSNNGRHLKRLPYRYQGDPEIVLAAVKQNGVALKYAQARLQDNKKIVMAAVKNNGRALRYSQSGLTKDRDIVRVAVSTWGKALKYAKKFKADKEIVSMAISQNGDALKYASTDLKNDEELARLALLPGDAPRESSELLAREESVPVADIAASGLDDFWNDRDAVLTAVKNSGLALQYAAPEFLSDRELVLFAVQSSASALQFASFALRSDFEFTLECVRRNPESMAFAAPCLQASLVWVHRAVKLTI